MISYELSGFPVLYGILVLEDLFLLARHDCDTISHMNTEAKHWVSNEMRELLSMEKRGAMY